MIDIAVTSLCESSEQLLISTSSGANHMLSVGNPILLNSWENIHKSCEIFITGGFTNNEATRYFEHSSLSFDDVYPFTGTNPLLLSLALKKDPRPC